MSAVPPLYNMGGSSSLDDRASAVHVLWSGIDTLETWYAASVLPAWLEHLDWAKLRARKRDVPEPVTLGLTRYGVDRKGLKPWAYLLRSPDLHLRLGRGKSGASIRCLSLGLAARGAAALLAEGERAIEACGAILQKRVSRIDVAVDFQGWTPGLAEMRDAVCPASFRPIYPSIDSPETFQFGRGDIVGRVYNKTAEVARGGSHWPGVWREDPCYDPCTDVWRVEFQYRTDALRDMGILTPDDALARVGDLFVTGFDWLSVREPGGHSNRRRRPEHWAWTAVRSATPIGEVLERCRDSHAYMHAVQYIPQVSGLLVSIGAHLGLHDPSEVLSWVMRAMGEHHADKVTDFERLVIERQLELFGVSTSDGLEPVYAHIGL